MPRAPKACGKPGCTQRVTGKTYCPQHQAEALALMDKRRGTTRQRGYDARHDREGRAAKVAALGTPCPRCGQPMLPGQSLHYGHVVARSIDPTSRASRVEHARCNMRAGAS